MADGQIHRDAGTHAVANDVGLADLEIVEQAGNVVCQVVVTEIAVDVGGAAMSLHLDRNDPPGFGKRGDHLRPIEIRQGHERTVQQYDGLALAVNLVVHLEAVHGRVACRWLLRPNCG